MRVCSGEVGGAKDGGRVSCFGQGSKFLSATRTGVQMPWKRTKSWTADVVGGLTGRELGVPRCDGPWVQKEEKKTRLLSTRCRFSRVF